MLGVTVVVGYALLDGACDEDIELFKVGCKESAPACATINPN